MNKPSQTKVRISAGEFLKRSSATDWLVAAFTAALTVTAILQYIVTQSQLNTSQTDIRAWMSFEPYDPSAPKNEDADPLLEGSVLKYKLKASNTGKTPAMDVREHVFIALIRRSDRPPLELIDNPKQGFLIESGSVIPNRAIETFIFRHVSGASEPTPLTADGVKALEAQRLDVVIFGRIDYSDVFKRRHWTRYCRVLTGGYPSNECAQYNRVDTD